MLRPLNNPKSLGRLCTALVAASDHIKGAALVANLDVVVSIWLVRPFLWKRGRRNICENPSCRFLNLISRCCFCPCVFVLHVCGQPRDRIAAGIVECRALLAPWCGMWCGQGSPANCKGDVWDGGVVLRGRGGDPPPPSP